MDNKWYSLTRPVTPSPVAAYVRTMGGNGRGRYPGDQRMDGPQVDPDDNDLRGDSTEHLVPFER